MPTLEEYKQEIETLKAGKAGEIAKYKQDLDAATAHATKLAEENTILKENLSAYKQAERDELVAKVHAIDKDYEVKDQSNLVLEAYVHGFERAKAAQSAAGKTDPPGPKPKDKVPPKDAFGAFFQA